MQVRVLFFGMLKDVVGQNSESLSLPESATLGDLLTHYEKRIPRLKNLLPSIALSVNQEYSGPDVKLKTNDEIALLPPVSGGFSASAQDRKSTRLNSSHGSIS